ncbi:MAG: hypothetical protein FJZ47_16050 [Candidatus Tectomicrobia bacterium]|uniref:Type I restriction enzyme R protein N-terminal domain-containing protein n=1 Tax=Tectimicrobiota bacterium TaxID=2528274 RepID=A0A938B1T0_UNCTE|nr:hypothetical protein [Candidatus Tectomicrobia bacterium]
MAYGDFTLYDLTQRWHIATEEDMHLFTHIDSIAISAHLAETLQENLPLALAIHSEKARSEMIIAPLLIEFRKLTGHRISLFSGLEFTVDAQQGLNGFCDFIISYAREQLFISFPIILIVEAKNENIKGGIPQCIAAMIAARLFNEQHGKTLPVLYGAVTTGESWKFLRLEATTVSIDVDTYYAVQPGKILGILLSMLPALPEEAGRAAE